jgi:hypothetical protein
MTEAESTALLPASGEAAAAPGTPVATSAEMPLLRLYMQNCYLSPGFFTWCAPTI